MPNDALQTLRAHLAQELYDWKDAGGDPGRVVFQIERLIQHFVCEAPRTPRSQEAQDK